ncbi:hypothetical protein G9A89_004554 [Geosiphon pyriformis]|nr:hypothetical protein G9A89_004554 [Geosiphon pyriformis]
MPLPTIWKPTNQQATLTSNIPPVIVTNDEFLTAIFSFELEEPFQLLLFSGAILEEKPITAMYTDAKTASTRIITADGAMKMPIGEIDNFPIEVNSIVTPIKIPVMCGHFKATNTMAPLIDFEKEKPKPTWEAYQVLWANVDHNKLLPILTWDNDEKKEKTYLENR